MSVKKYKGFTIDENKPKGQKFGHPTFIKYGKEIDIQEYIEEGRVDTEIYPCLEKYGCLKPLERTPSEIYGDFTEYNDLRGNLEKAKKIKDMWANIDTKIKNEFNNDMNEFIDRGMQWAKGQIEAEKAQQAQTQVQQPETTEVK